MLIPKAVFSLALEHDFSLALIPEKSEKKLIKFFNLPTEPDKSVELACRENTQAIDLVLCNLKFPNY